MKQQSVQLLKLPVNLWLPTIVEWVEPSSEMPVFVTIACGLPKGDKLELIVQKGTELGAACIFTISSGSINCKMG